MINQVNPLAFISFPSQSADVTQQGDRSAGWALMAAAVLSVFAMAHHPTGAHGTGLAGIVHGTMIFVVSLMAFGFLHFARRRGLDRPLVLAGLVAFAISLFANLGAATINGFVVPALAERGAVGHDAFLLAWEANQALARLGLFATGGAFIAWGAVLVGRRDVPALIVGMAGIAAGAAPALLLVLGTIRMDVAGAFIAYAAHASWSALAGWLLLRRLGWETPSAVSSE